jgi:hypothetical protein
MFRGVRSWVLVAAVLAVPAAAVAQDAVLTGTVTDATGGVLPGVTVTAVNEATGNTFVGVTDGTGSFRIPARVGAYRITAELQGFTTVQRTGVQLLVGQTINVDLQMNPSTIQETVTVTAEAPLIEVNTSSLGGNIDPTQVQELPVEGRNWLALSMLAPGSRTTPGTVNTNPLPDRNDGEVREYQLNLDGQQVTQDLGTGVQPRYSQDSIAEFQFISNRFDATMGRSSGVQVKAITRSGTNQLQGLFRANFRDDRFNAEEPISGRVLPMNNQQLSGTLGGPIVRDRLHYFGNFEYERSPSTAIWNTPFPEFNVTISGKETIKMGGGRLDYQITPNNRLMGKWHEGRRFTPYGAVGGTGILPQTSHPASAGFSDEANREVLGQLTQVFNNTTVNEVKVGYSDFGFDQGALSRWSNHWDARNGTTTGSPRIRFRGFDITPNTNWPRRRAQDVISFRDDLTLSYEARGRHDLRTGLEYLHRREDSFNRRLAGGEIDARNGLPANLPALFPDPFNVDTWNLAAISPLVRNYRIGVGDFSLQYTQPKFGVWAQDDWQISDRLTLNLGLRWDLSKNASANDVAVPPFLEAGRPDDLDNYQPRVGFAYQLTDRTILRGGSGLYYYDPITTDTMWTVGNSQVAVIQIPNDGRPNFAADPLNGRPLPTFEEAQQVFCHVNRVAGCLQNSLNELVAPEEFSRELGRTWQNSIGMAHQIGGTMAFTADYVYSRGRNEKDIIDNINLTFDPATGANFPFSDVSRRAFPDWGNISLVARTGRSAYHALQTSITKRMSNRWQATATYTLAGLWDSESPPFTGDAATGRIFPVPFETAPDLGGEWSLSEADQRHRFVLNAIWEVGRGFQASGLVYHGSGIRDAAIFSGDLRGTGADFSNRLRPDGSIIPRNSYIQPAENRVDLRLQQRIPLGGVAAVDLIGEVFNLFNANNFVEITDEASPQYGEPGVGFYRTMQFGFRVTF